MRPPSKEDLTVAQMNSKLTNGNPRSSLSLSLISKRHFIKERTQRSFITLLLITLARSSFKGKPLHISQNRIK
jgi:hypothetical protein